jgi:hypothetical protein
MILFRYPSKDLSRSGTGSLGSLFWLESVFGCSCPWEVVAIDRTAFIVLSLFGGANRLEAVLGRGSRCRVRVLARVLEDIIRGAINMVSAQRSRDKRLGNTYFLAAKYSSVDVWVDTKRAGRVKITSRRLSGWKDRPGERQPANRPRIAGGKKGKSGIKFSIADDWT